MKYDLSLNRDINPNKILLVGSGFSLDMYDTSKIDRKTIVISLNSSAITLPHIDYYLVSNWMALRKSILDYVPAYTQILCYANLSHVSVHHTDDFISLDNPENFNVKDISEFFVNDHDTDKLQYILQWLGRNIFRRQPLFINYYLSKDMLKNPEHLMDYYEKGEFPANTGTGSFGFSLAYYLSKRYNIKNIEYVGIDLCDLYLKDNDSLKRRYPVCLDSTSETIKNKYCNIDAVNYENRLLEYDVKIPDTYKYQIISILLIVSFNEGFYNSIKCLSGFDVKLTKYSFLVWLRESAIGLLNKESEMKVPGVNIMDLLYDEILDYLTNCNIDLIDGIKSNLYSNYKKNGIVNTYKSDKRYFDNIPTGMLWKREIK